MGGVRCSTDFSWCFGNDAGRGCSGSLRSDIHPLPGRTHGRSKGVFHRLIPYLSFALQHLEVAIHIEKRVLETRGILPNSRMRQPSIRLDDIYQAQMEELIGSVIELCEECRAAQTV